MHKNIVYTSQQKYYIYEKEGGSARLLIIQNFKFYIDKLKFSFTEGVMWGFWNFYKIHWLSRQWIWPHTHKTEKEKKIISTFTCINYNFKTIHIIMFSYHYTHNEIIA